MEEYQLWPQQESLGQVTQLNLLTGQGSANWLVRARSHQTSLQHTKTLVALCQELVWIEKKVFKLPVGPKGELGQTDHRVFAEFKCKNTEIALPNDL